MGVQLIIFYKAMMWHNMHENTIETINQGTFTRFSTIFTYTGPQGNTVYIFKMQRKYEKLAKKGRADQKTAYV